MKTTDNARDGVEAVERFNALLGVCAPDHVQVKLDGRGGMARLCEVELALTGLWPNGPSKELVWLSCGGGDDVDRLQLQAFSADGSVLCAEIYCLEQDAKKSTLIAVPL